ncbi:growth-regulating factor 4-like isoform X1 [Dioscorea cayenensis subsp. rotundata]|uniref:Growth-regulating factor n=1 Tax=Dioscorea cayennensis subsp. rotundata TaxID=55577 RepID=A0AB40B2W7_DIOCR|nr:growth-regulating factor 4-like isoform X1 [Dioscorea cayenensis subsp. rotundata]
MNMDMDSSSQQWGSQQEPDQHQNQAKVSKLQLMTDEQEIHASALPLFAATPINHTRTTSTPTLTPFPPDSSHTSRFSWGAGGGMVGLFSLAQWQELELQALIYKYMLAGAPVPLDLILPIRKSLLSAHPYYHHHQLQYQHFPTPAMLQSGYWGRCVIDPEPGRCRRTDGKKWRCSREVVPSHKYCERHVHRGRNRSRKHVEVLAPTPTTTTKDDDGDDNNNNNNNNHFAPHHHHHHHQTSRGTEDDGRQSYCTNYPDQNEGHVLRKFFNERPRSQGQQESISSASGGGGSQQTLLSISIPGDVSLKLSTGSSKDNGDGGGGAHHNAQQSPANLNVNVNVNANANINRNWSEWGHGNENENNGETASGGPLAEALLRSSTSTASPTSVLQKPCGISASETSSISISS